MKWLLSTLLIAMVFGCGDVVNIEPPEYESKYELEGRWQGIAWQMRDKTGEIKRTDLIDIVFGWNGDQLVGYGTYVADWNTFLDKYSYSVGAYVIENDDGFLIVANMGGSTITYVCEKKGKDEIQLKTIFDHKETGDVYVWERAPEFFSKR